MSTGIAAAELSEHPSVDPTIAPPKRVDRIEESVEEIVRGGDEEPSRPARRSDLAKMQTVAANELSQDNDHVEPPTPEVEPMPEEDIEPSPRFHRSRRLLGFIHPALDDGPDQECAQPPRRSPPPTPLERQRQRRRVALTDLFLMHRRFRRNPPTSKVVEALVGAGEDCARAEKYVEEFKTVLQAAFRICKENRQAAFVLAAMEIYCRQGSQEHCKWEISLLTGQRSLAMSQSLDFLCREGIADVGSARYSYYQGYHLIRPLLVKEGPERLGPFTDPIDLFRLDPEELSSLPDYELKASVLDAVLQAVEDRISRRESEIESEIGRCRDLEAADELIRDEANARLERYREQIASLQSELASVRWQARNPFKVETAADRGDLATLDEDG